MKAARGRLVVCVVLDVPYPVSHTIGQCAQFSAICCARLHVREQGRKQVTTIKYTLAAFVVIIAAFYFLHRMSQATEALEGYTYHTEHFPNENCPSVVNGSRTDAQYIAMVKAMSDECLKWESAFHMKARYRCTDKNTDPPFVAAWRSPLEKAIERTCNKGNSK